MILMKKKDDAVIIGHSGIGCSVAFKMTEPRRITINPAKRGGLSWA
jgi:hypothetical protein